MKGIFNQTFIEVHDGFGRQAGGESGFYVACASSLRHYDQGTFTNL